VRFIVFRGVSAVRRNRQAGDAFVGGIVNVQSLLQTLALDELTYEAPALTAWETGIVSNAEDVAMFMYRGGPFPPQSSAKDHLIKEDHRPERKYCTFKHVGRP